jgi:hypothetical protein
VQTDYVSILRFIQWNFGLSSLNSRNALSNNSLDLFELPLGQAHAISALRGITCSTERSSLPVAG